MLHQKCLQVKECLLLFREGSEENEEENVGKCNFGNTGYLCG
jgi:hypothetical protein